jgi:molecular chaperone GrpE
VKLAKEDILEPEDMAPEDVAPENVTGEQPQEAEVATEPLEGTIVVEPVEEEAALDEVTALRQELAESKAKEAEYLDGWQRARAELSNARKRFQREPEQAYANAKADVLARLLPIVDDFERARETAPDNPAEPAWVAGVLLIQRKLKTLLDQDGVVPIEAVGQEFDPFLHQAITHEPSDMVPEGHVIAEMHKGYRMGDRVLRPSMVRVSSGKVEVEAEAEGKAKTGK